MRTRITMETTASRPSSRIRCRPNGMKTTMTLRVTMTALTAMMKMNKTSQ